MPEERRDGDFGRYGDSGEDRPPPTLQIGYGCGQRERRRDRELKAGIEPDRRGDDYQERGRPDQRGERILRPSTQVG